MRTLSNRSTFLGAASVLGVFLTQAACPPPPQNSGQNTGPGQTGPTSAGEPAKKPATEEVATRPEQPPAPVEHVPELKFPENEAFRAEQPAAGEPRSFKLPPVQRFKLKNGLQVYLIENHTLPTISVDLNFDGGAITDPQGKEGLASICMAMMSEGTADLDKLAFREALADTGSFIWSYGDDDALGVGMRTLSKHLPATHALLRDTLLNPGMRPEDFKRMVERNIEDLKQRLGRPGAVASRIGRAVLYGAAHPRGRLVTEASYQAITLADCQEFHKRYVKPGGARLFVVGDMTQAQIRSLFDRDGLKGFKGRAPRPARQPAPKSQKGKIFFVNMPGAAQSAVYLGHFGPKRKARDYMATRIMSAVLGGGFTSRINMNLREDKGYSYGARGRMSYNRDYGVMFMSSAVRSDSTYQTIKEMMGEMTALKSGARPVTDEELNREKDGDILGLPANFARSRQALEEYRNLVYHGLPMNYYNSFIDQVAKVTGKQVMAAAKKHLSPERALIVVVGDGDSPLIVRNGKTDEPLMKDGQPVTLRAGLADLIKSGELGKGELFELDVDGQLVSQESVE